MISAKISVPILHCTSQYDEKGNSEPYLWFAYFWADITTLNMAEPISVYVPPFSNIRGLFPDDIGNNRDIAIPPELGTFQISLDDAGSHIALLGILIVLMEQDETPDDAIAAGYDAYRDAVRRELNKYVSEYGLTPPSDGQIKEIVNAITKSVYDAIKSKLSILSKLFDNQDDFLGHVRGIFFGQQLHAGPTPSVMDLGLPPIDQDAYKVVIQSINPLRWSLVKVGHQHYEFVRPILTLQQVTGACEEPSKVVRGAVAALKALRDLLGQQKTKLAEASEQEKPVIRKTIADLRTNQIPQAQKALDAAQRALQACSMQTKSIGITDCSQTGSAPKA